MRARTNAERERRTARRIVKSARLLERRLRNSGRPSGSARDRRRARRSEKRQAAPPVEE